MFTAPSITYREGLWGQIAEENTGATKKVHTIRRFTIYILPLILFG
jgi:hypothetical protein